MNHKDQFSKWIKAVEGVLSDVRPVDSPEQNGCGCGSWTCDKCFPPQTMPNNEPVMTFGANDSFGDVPTNKIGHICPNCGTEISNNDEDHESCMPFDDGMETDLGLELESSCGGMGAAGVAQAYKQVQEEDNVFTDFNHEDSVRLGKITHQNPDRESGGQNSPLTYGDYVLSENPEDEDTEIDRLNLINSINAMQNMGLSKATEHYDESELEYMQPEQLKSIYGQVIGEVAEDVSPVNPDIVDTFPVKPSNFSQKSASTGSMRDILDRINSAMSDSSSVIQENDKKRTKTQTKSNDKLTDINFTNDDNLPANFSNKNKPVQNKELNLPIASKQDTINKTKGLVGTEQMRDMLNRINSDIFKNVGSDSNVGYEVDNPGSTTLPKVVDDRLRTAGMQEPEWHLVTNLPGYNNKMIREIGKQMFSMLTTEPINSIKAVANVGGMGPNTNLEVNAVAGWLQQNAKSLGYVDIDFGQVMPGYEPEAIEYEKGDSRFLVVRDFAGTYIYSWPSSTSIKSSSEIDYGDFGHNTTPAGRLHENVVKGTLFEQINWDIELDEALSEINNDLDESSLYELSNDTLNSYIGKAERKANRDRNDAKQAGKLAGDYSKSRGERAEWQDEREWLDNRAKGTEDNIAKAKSKLKVDETEEIIDESTLSRTIGQEKGGQKLVQWLHKKHKLSNEAELIAVPYSRNVLWTQFKKNPDDFVIVGLQNGVAAIKPSEEYINHMTNRYAKKGKEYNPGKDSNLRYQVVAFTDDGEQLDPRLFQITDDKDKEDDFKSKDPTVIRTRMGMVHGKDTQRDENVFNRLQEELGKMVTVWVSGFGPAWRNQPGMETPEYPETPGGSLERGKMAARHAHKNPPEMPEEQSISRIISKIMPVLGTVASQAISKINKLAQEQLTAGNYDEAQKIAANGNSIKQFIQQVETSGGNSPEFRHTIEAALQDASGSQKGTSEYNSWLNDAAKGNSLALKPVLISIRNKLMSHI